MKLKVKDKIIIIAGKHKGKVGTIARIDRKQNKVIIDKVNMVIRYRKKTANAPGQKIEKEAPIHASNIMILDPKTGKPTRIGYRYLSSGKKERYAKKSGEVLT